MMPHPLRARGAVSHWLAAALIWLPGAVAAQTPAAPAWLRTNADLRVGFETVKLPGQQHMGLLGTSYLLELRPGLCVGPAVYGAISGQHGGLFTVGAETALCTNLIGPLSMEAGLYVGAGGGGAAPTGSGLMLRPHVDLFWDFGGYRAGVSVSNVRFPSGQIDSTQVGIVFGADTAFVYVPSGRSAAPFYGQRSGVGLERVVGVGGVYKTRAGSKAMNGLPLKPRIGYVGARADRFMTPNLYAGVEASAALSGDVAGYAEFLGTLGAEWPLAGDRFRLGGHVALGMGGGGGVPVGGGLLAKAALDASLRLARDFSLNLEGGWASAPQGSFRAPFASLGLRWDMDHPQGQPTRLTRQEWAAGIETFRLAARKSGPAQSLQNVTLKLNRFVSPVWYLSGQVQSSYSGNAGGFSVGLLGAGAQTRIGDWFLVGAELLAGAAGGGGVATGSGVVVKPMAYVGVELTPALSLRLGAGHVTASNGALSSNVADLTLAYSFGVASRP